MGLRTARFSRALSRFRRMGLDSSILIYHLEDTRPYSELTEVAFAAIADGTPEAVLSTLSVTELLVKPSQQNRPDRIDACERFVLSLPNTILAAPGYAVSKDAARLVARYGLRVPDAILAATVRTERSQALLTNDRGLRRLRAEGITVLVLDDYLP